MDRKNITIKRTIEITMSVPMETTAADVEQWIDNNLIPSCSLEKVDADLIIKDIRLAVDDDDQDAFVVVSWPESQELMDYEGFYENCDFISGDTLEPCSYLVRKNWYGKLLNGKLQKVAEYEAA